MADPNLLDIAIQNADDGVCGLIEETTRAHPELLLIPARTISGQNYKTLIRTSLPGVAFRNANEGMARTKGTYENRLIETFIFNPRWAADKAVADRAEDGPSAYIAREAKGIVEAAMQALSESFYYGLVDTDVHATAGDAKGFPGLHAHQTFTTADNILVDGGGTEVAAGSSVWMIRTGMEDVCWVWGEGGQLGVDPARTESISDGTNDYTAYTQEMLAYPGLQIGSVDCVGRIGELDSADQVLTDDMLANLWSKFYAGRKPNLILMSRRSQYQLQKSRSAQGEYFPGGISAPFPTSWEGIPIHVTDAILDTEVVDKIS